MRWSMLMVLLGVAVIESQLDLNIGLFHIPLLIIILLASFFNDWLSYKELVLFGALSGYLLDVLGGIYPGVVAVTMIATIGLFMLINKRYNQKTIALISALALYSGLLMVGNGLNSAGYLIIALLYSFYAFVVFYVVYQISRILERRI